MLTFTIATETFKIPPRAYWDRLEVKPIQISEKKFTLPVDNERSYLRACRKALGITGRKGWRFHKELPWGERIWTRKGVARSAHHIKSEPGVGTEAA